MNEMVNNFDALPLQINIDEYCGDESEEKNPYPANDYIGNAQTRCVSNKVQLFLCSTYTYSKLLFLYPLISHYFLCSTFWFSPLTFTFTIIFFLPLNRRRWWRWARDASGPKATATVRHSAEGEGHSHAWGPRFLHLQPHQQVRGHCSFFLLSAFLILFLNLYISTYWSFMIPSYSNIILSLSFSDSGFCAIRSSTTTSSPTSSSSSSCSAASVWQQRTQSKMSLSETR